LNGSERFLAACARKPVDRTPVWMMRQAGRYLPEYRAMRAKVDFLTLCKTPDLAAEVALQPIERFGMDGCVIFSDILVPVEAMGAPVSFGDAGPKLDRPVRTIADVDRLRVPDPRESMPFALEALRLARAALAERAALVGFVGGPFTLASYLIEGGGSKTYAMTKQLLYSEPEFMHSLLAKLTRTVADYAAAQIAAGAQAIQVFDTWAGELAHDAYVAFAVPYQAEVIARIKRAGVPAILFVNGCAGKLDAMMRAGADVLSIDWRVDLAAVRAQVGDGFALQGNVDPCVLLAEPAVVSNAAHQAMKSAGPLGHILNLGHGILPPTPIECAQAFVDAPKSLAASSSALR
jgi:uroporphyrinogen decarboxylase